MTFTYDGLIEQIKQEKDGIMGIHIPSMSMHFLDFSDAAGLSKDDYPTLQAYIKKASYQEKRNVFETLGFKVLFMTLSAVKAIHFVEGRTAGAPTNPCIDEAFLENQRNVFILDVDVLPDNLFFVIEYESDDSLANYTVDREKLVREQETKAKLATIFGKK